MILAALAAGLFAHTSACSPVAMFDTFGEVPFETADVTSLIGTVLTGDCADVGDCQLVDRSGVSYGILDGRIVRKSVTPSDASSLPYGLRPADSYQDVRTRLELIDSNAKVDIVFFLHPGTTIASAPLCLEATWVSVRLEQADGPISNVSIFSQI